MALRITSRGMLSIEYDMESEKWNSRLRPPRLSDLGRVVEIEPGLSLGMLFDVVAQSHELMEVVGEMCFVNAPELHARSRLGGEEMRLSDFGKVKSRPDTVVDELVLERILSLSEGMLDDPPAVREEDRCPDFSPAQWLDYGLAVNGREWRLASRLGLAFEPRSPVPESVQDFPFFVDWLASDLLFASIVHLPLRLSMEACIYSNRLRYCKLPFPWRFYEVLLATHGPFGKPPHYLDVDQAELLLSEECNEIIRRFFESRESEPPEEDQEEGEV